MTRGVHGEKIVALLTNAKLPTSDVARVNAAIARYDAWIHELQTADAPTLSKLVSVLVHNLTMYKQYIDLDFIFDSEEDFLYRQKGQLKLDNTVMEEFLPIFVRRCIEKETGSCDLVISSQAQVFSSAYFESSLAVPAIGGGLQIKTKAQDFSISRPLHLLASYSSGFEDDQTLMRTTSLGYTMAELKTNLDKTMFQEAAATAHDVKIAIPSSKYYLLCDFLDMKPISTSTTDIEAIFILRKAKRISSNVRKSYATHNGRVAGRAAYKDYLWSHPYSVELFEDFIGRILQQLAFDDLSEEDVLNRGLF